MQINMSESAKKSIPAYLHETFMGFLSKAMAQKNNEILAYAEAYVQLDKIKGIYSSVPVSETTGKRLKEWMDKYGIPNQIPVDKLHCTIVHSREPFAGYETLRGPVIVTPTLEDEWSGEYRKNYSIIRLGKEKGTLALKFDCPVISKQLWEAIRLGAERRSQEYDFDPMALHISLSYNAPDFDISKIKDMPEFDLVFGDETLEPLVENWSETISKEAEDDNFIIKIDFDESKEPEKMLVYGWASVAKVNGDKLIDHHGDYIDEENLVNAAHNFIKNSRRGDFMHSIEGVGEIVESIVFTSDLQKALGIDLNKIGWFIGIKIQNEAVWEGVKKGNFRAFSIGGKGYRVLLEE